MLGLQIVLIKMFRKALGVGVKFHLKIIVMKMTIFIKLETIKY